MNLNTPLQQVGRQEISASLRRKFIPHKRKANAANVNEDESRSSSATGSILITEDVRIEGTNVTTLSASSHTCMNMTVKDGQNNMKTNHRHDYDQGKQKQKDRKVSLVKVRNPYIQSARKPSLKRPRYFTPKQTPTPRTHQETIWNPYKNEYQVMLSASTSTPHVRVQQDNKVNSMKEEKLPSKPEPEPEHFDNQSKKQSPYRRTSSNNQAVFNPYVKTPQSYRQNLAHTTPMIQRQRSSVHNPYAKKTRHVASAPFQPTHTKTLQVSGTHISLPTPSSSLATRSEPITYGRKSDTFSPQAQAPTPFSVDIKDNFMSNELQQNEHSNYVSMENEELMLLSGRIEKVKVKEPYAHSLAGLYTIAQAQKFLKPHSTIKETHLKLPKRNGTSPGMDGVQSHVAMTKCHLAPRSSRFQPINELAESCDSLEWNASKMADRYSLREDNDTISTRSLPLKQCNFQPTINSKGIALLEKGSDGNQTNNSIEINKGRGNKRNFLGNRRPIASGRTVRNIRQQNSANYLKKDLSIGNRSETLIESPIATRRPYPLAPSQNVPLLSIPLPATLQQNPWEFHFLADAMKAANIKYVEVNSNKNITERLILSASYYSRCHHKTVRLMGCITAGPENILYQEGSKRQGPQQEHMAFIFDDGTSHIDAICISELAESRSDKRTPTRIPKRSDFVDCIGYIQHIACNESVNSKAGSIMVFMIEDIKFIDDPALETLRMMNVMSKEEKKLQQTQKVSHKLMGLKAEINVSSLGGHVASPVAIEDSLLDISRMLELIQQSKPEGLSGDDLAILLDVKGNPGMNVLRNGLNRLQLDLHIYETSEGSYAPI